MEVIYEDNHIIAINKACGEIVQGQYPFNKIATKLPLFNGNKAGYFIKSTEHLLYTFHE